MKTWNNLDEAVDSGVIARIVVENEEESR